MRMRAERRSSEGFTLVELMVSATLMAVILGAAYATLRSGLDSQKLVHEREELLQSARAALDLICADLRNACVLSKEYEFLGMKRTIGGLEADNLDFATRHYSPKRNGEADWCETSYFLTREKNSRGLVLWRRRDPTRDDAPLDGGRKEELVHGVLGLRFEYYDGFEWFEQWGDVDGKQKTRSSASMKSNLSGLPEAVRVTLSLTPSSTPTPKPELNKAEGEATTPEPPMVFQTVVRLVHGGEQPDSAPSSGGSPTPTPTPSPGSPPAQFQGGML